MLTDLKSSFNLSVSLIRGNMSMHFKQSPAYICKSCGYIANMGISWWDKAPTLTIHWYTDIAVIECTKSSKELSNSRLLLPLLTKADSDSGDKPAQRPGYNKHSSNQARISQSSSLVGSSSGLYRLYYSWIWILMNLETMTSWILSKNHCSCRATVIT